jgi:hypothetical protein
MDMNQRKTIKQSDIRTIKNQVYRSVGKIYSQSEKENTEYGDTMTQGRSQVLNFGYHFRNRFWRGYEPS